MKKCSKGIKILAVIYVAVILFIIAAYPDCVDWQK